MSERYLSVVQVAELMGTTERFPRRLVSERRITFVKFGRHVRIPESAVATYIREHTIEPARPRRRMRRAA
ncbi:excisionase family DNA-binding protein [Streptomyces sp. NPDC051561]|uniref:excisionase family DNA-binding protein n=1 Tax=Streptomyces sp. NPDC051561 TaxID=3365658 RepID=UPI00379DBA16